MSCAFVVDPTKNAKPSLKEDKGSRVSRKGLCLGEIETVSTTKLGTKKI